MAAMACAGVATLLASAQCNVDKLCGSIFSLKVNWGIALAHDGLVRSINKAAISRTHGARVITSFTLMANHL